MLRHHQCDRRQSDSDAGPQGEAQGVRWQRPGQAAAHHQAVSERRREEHDALSTGLKTTHAIAPSGLAGPFPQRLRARNSIGAVLHFPSWQAKGIERDSKRYQDAAADGSEKHSRRMRGDDALSSTAAFNLQAIRRQIRGQYCDEKAK
jgi:hypothetical protein